MSRSTIAAVVFSLAVVAAGCSGARNTTNGTDFYTTPRNIPASSPGSVVRTEPMAAPTASSAAWRIMYTSNNDAGKPIVVTGMILAPTAPPPPAGRPVVAWAHPTTGIDDACAPSKQSNPFDSIMGLNEFLEKGWVVVATDYEGLGTDGEHPYLIGASEARSVLDSVRAAHRFAEARASTRFGVFGHSQGGQAALFTGQLAAGYAPELTLVGTVAAAPSGDLRAQFDITEDTEAYSYIGSYMITSWSDLYGARSQTAVAPAATQSVTQLAAACVVGGSQAADARLQQIFDTDPPVSPSMWLEGFTNSEPWRSLLADNSPGGSTIPVPTLITQGTADKVIPPATTAELVTRLRANGTAVSEQELPGVPHTLAGYRSVPYALDFFSQRLA